MEKKTWLLIIFLITLTIRLILAFTIPNFTYESYFHLRQVEHITEHGLPLFEDELSYSGRELRFLPLFHYLMGFFNLFLPLTIIAKIIPNLLIASLTILTYLIALRYTANKTAALFSAIVSGFLPIIFLTNAFVPQTLAIPLLFLTLYSFIRIKEKKFQLIYLISFLGLTLTGSVTFLLIIGFGIYLSLLVIERKKIDRQQIEFILFSLFFFIWIHLIFFKQVLLNRGINFFWLNIPSQIISQYFPVPTITQAIILVSLVPFIAGIYIVYRSLFTLRDQKSFLLISFVISTIILSWFRLIKFNLSLAFFGIILSILFALFYDDLNRSLLKTKFANYREYLPHLTLILLILTTIVPAISTAYEQQTPTNEELEAFEWLKENTPAQSTIVVLLEEGHLLTYISQRRNIMDDQFSLIDDTDTRFKDLQGFFTSSFETRAIEALDKYQARYLVLSARTQKKYDIKKFKFHSPECFKKIYENKTKIYQAKCSLKRK